MDIRTVIWRRPRIRDYRSRRRINRAFIRRSSLRVHVGVVRKSCVRVIIVDRDFVDLREQALVNFRDVCRGATGFAWALAVKLRPDSENSKAMRESNVSLMEASSVAGERISGPLGGRPVSLIARTSLRTYELSSHGGTPSNRHALIRSRASSREWRALTSEKRR